jgi:hypothetical protein
MVPFPSPYFVPGSRILSNLSSSDLVTFRPEWWRESDDTRKSVRRIGGEPGCSQDTGPGNAGEVETVARGERDASWASKPRNPSSGVHVSARQAIGLASGSFRQYLSGVSHHSGAQARMPVETALDGQRNGNLKVIKQPASPLDW